MEPSLRARIRGGEPDAFGLLFDADARAVYNLAFRLTGDWAAAEDAVSLTFLEAWRLRARVDIDGGSLRPWLLGIAVNVVRNSSRARRRHQAALSRLPPPPEVPDFADSLVARIDDAARLARLRAAMAGLNQGEREVIALCAWSGLDYEQAARALGVPIGTIRSRLSRARAKLRKLVAAAESGGPVATGEPGGPLAAGEPGAGLGQEVSSRGHAARLMREGSDGRQ